MATRRLRGVLGLVALGVLAGCQAQRPSAPLAPPMPASARAESVADSAAPASPGLQAPKAGEAPVGGARTAAALNRKIVYHGELALEVADIDKAVGAVQAIARQCGGYLTGMQQTGGGTNEGELSIRVPAARFEAALEELKKLGKLLRRSVKADDVTDQFVDLEARIRSKQQEETAILDLLRHAGQVSALLEVEKELSRVRGEIEQAQGQLKLLSNQVDLSTLEVKLSLPPAQSLSGWRFGHEWSRASKLFIDLGQGLISLLLTLLALAPYVALAVLVAWSARRLATRR